MKFTFIFVVIVVVLSSFVTTTSAYWQIDPVDSTGDVGQYCSMARSGAVFGISYYDQTHGYLKYAELNPASGLQIGTVDPFDDTGLYTSLVLGESGIPYISYYDQTHGDLRWARRSTEDLTWNLYLVDSLGNTGKYSSQAISDTGNLGISYFGPAGVDDLKYATPTGSTGWQNETVSVSAGMYTSLVFGPDGYPRISSYGNISSSLKLAIWDGTNWHFHVLDSDGIVGKYSSQAIDTAGASMVSYYDETNGALKYAECTESSYFNSNVDTGGDVGLYTSIALDSRGNPHISYFNNATGDLKYASWTGGRWDPSGWDIQTVDSAGVVGEFSSLVMDSSDNPHISYYDRTNGNLKYARFVPGTEIGVFRPSTHTFYLDFNDNSAWNGAIIDRSYAFGLTGDSPVSGDWDNDGTDEIGVFRPSTHTFYLDYNGNGAWNGAVTDRSYAFGLTGDSPIAGDWDNDGTDEIGVFRPSTHTFYLDYNGNGAWNGAVFDRSYGFGLTGDSPVSGDWDNDGTDEIGVFRPSTHTFYLDYNGNGAWNGAVTDRSYGFGLTGDSPIAGDWNLNGITDIGVFRPSTHTFYLDYNGNGAWNGAVTDRSYGFGLTGDSPVIGKWS